MTAEEYLKEVLESQKLSDDSKELRELQEHRADVEAALRRAFDECDPTIRYGGSKAKETMILDSYDLDVICYFSKDDTAAGETLEDIYSNVRKALEKNYHVIPKTSALRLKSKDIQAGNPDFHIDVVPGRYVDGDDGDCFIYQANAEKKRLKTNLDVHIRHVQKSGVREAIKLLKLWKVRKNLPLKQFIWELLIIKLLKGKASASLADQLTHVWTEICDSKDPIAVEDPANPGGNDLSSALSQNWQFISSLSDSTLKTIENLGWESLFGTIKRASGASRIAILTQAATGAAYSSKPWAEPT